MPALVSLEKVNKHFGDVHALRDVDLEVGSSNSITLGSIASARAIAARCCWPPDSSTG